MSTLSDYLRDANETQSAFAARVGCSRSFLNEVIRGVKAPSLSLALRMHSATGGKVAIQDLVPSATPAPGAEAAQ